MTADTETSLPQEALAIVGLAGRFPQAPDLDMFWHNLKHGIEGMTVFSDEELLARGVPARLISAPNFVKAAPVLSNIDQFDAAFFGYTPSEAQLIDPQQRIFLETAWHALEHAAIDPGSYPGTIGVFGGTSLSTYLLFNVLHNPRYVDQENDFEVVISNDKDFVCTRVAYNFDLRGPSFDVQTGCSTSLVATHLACEALLSAQCDVALAGAVSVNVPQRTGYLYEEGGIASPDGHCRAFDAKGQGTVFGSGVGVVVLKRLDDALRDNDTIHALILSSAINNDGAQKVGFTAPSVTGQTEVISRALALADIPAETIGYVEAHGTATALGDPIEVAALTNAFRADTDATQFCALGSVKTNIGHLDVAAGIAGLIKTVLALKHGEIPPSLHFEQPNPQIDFGSSPFFVNSTCIPWPRNGAPRRAGVSSFGIGGTNAHLIVQEAPALPATSPPTSQDRLVLLSGASESALEAVTSRLHEYLSQQPAPDLSDVAYTLQVGRKRLPWRRAFVCRDPAEATDVLLTLPDDRVWTTNQELVDRPVVFMFPGGGAQYVNMGRELYAAEGVFRQAVDRCAAILQRQLGYDLRDHLYPQQVDEQSLERIKDTSLALPALFTIEYAIAQQLIAWGIRPSALIGHSLGEYAAGCLAGVFSLEDALSMVVVRGQLFEQMPRGGMVSVLAPAEEIQALLDPDLSIAAINSPFQCVVSGTVAAIDRFAGKLAEHDIDCQPIKINVAAHSQLVDQILPQFVASMQQIDLHPPQIPLISNVSGSWITDAEATDPHYWGRQLRQAVQFQAGAAELLAEPGYVFVEIGPGSTLSTLLKAQADRRRAAEIITTVCHPREAIPADRFLLNAAGKLWASGVTLDWRAFYGAEQRRRIPLPGYPFERQSYWIEPQTQRSEPQPASGKLANPDEWFHTPVWQQTPPVASGRTATPRHWLLFVNDDELSQRLVALLQASEQIVTTVAPGAGFTAHDRHYTIHPGVGADYQALLQRLSQQDVPPTQVVHLWSVREATELVTAQRFGYNALIHLARAWQDAPWSEPATWWLIGQQMYRVESGDVVNPNYAINGAPCRVIPQEYPAITACYCVDIGRPSAQTARLLLADMLAAPVERVIAYRGRQRWRQSFAPVAITRDAPVEWPLRAQGVYLITGGLGIVGLQWATYLAQTYRARLVLLARSPFPARETWPQQIAANTPVSDKIRRIQALEAAGAEVLILAADVGSEAQLRAAMREAQQHFGRLHGIIHAAGIAGGKAIKVLADFEPTERESQFVPKVYGTYNLSRIVPELDLDFVLLVSSTVAIFGGVGLTTYSAANAFLDAFVASDHAQGTRWLSLNLDHLGVSRAQKVATSVDQYTLEPHESDEVLERVLTRSPVAHVVVSAADLPTRWDQWIVQAGRKESAEAEPSSGSHPRPKLENAYVPPSTPTEQVIAEIWQDLLGIDQIGIDDNFFMLGGDSLFAVRATSKLRKALEVDVPVASLYEGLTVRSLAAIVAGLHQEQRGDAAPIASAERHERREARQDRIEQLRSRRRK
ncbi:MAG TPA: SDR family NAD(P)-dependent oxidoreductase [Herpetosiphonaceae bacterium]